MFLRGLPQVCAKMRRPTKGEAGGNKDLGQHPDFYKISIFAPLPGESSGQDSLYIPPQKKVTTREQDKQLALTSEESPGIVSRDEHSGKIENVGEKESGDSDDRAETPEQNHDDLLGKIGIGPLLLQNSREPQRAKYLLV